MAILMVMKRVPRGKNTACIANFFKLFISINNICKTRAI